MSYCTQADIEKMIPPRELAEITAEEGTTPDGVIIAEAISLADGEINSYLAMRYTSLPLAPAPDRVKALSADMAIYHLFSRVDRMTEVRRQKYEDAVKFLKDVVAGRAQIIGADGAEPPGDTEAVTEISSATRVFSRDTMRGW